MNNRNKQVTWLCVAVATCITLATWVQSTPTETEVTVTVDNGLENYILKTEKNKKTAKFPHWAHQSRTECAVCHDEGVMPEAWTKKTGHALCKDCHKAEKAPKKCSTCHPKVKKTYEGC